MSGGFLGESSARYSCDLRGLLARSRAAFAKAGFEGLKFDAQPIVAKGEARFIEMEGSAPLS